MLLRTAFYQPTLLPTTAAPKDCKGIQDAFNDIAAGAGACLKASHNIELSDCTQTFDCTANSFNIPSPNNPCANEKKVLSITLKAAAACKTDRPTLLVQSGGPGGLEHLILIEDPRVALTVKSVIFACGGHRPGIQADAGKSISLAEVDFNECAALGGSAVSSYSGGPVKIKNGAFRNGAGTIPSLDVRDVPGSKGTLLSATGTLFTGNQPDAGSSNIYILKSTANKLKAVFRNCKFIDNAADSQGRCIVQSFRMDDKSALAPGQPLTLDFGGGVFSGAAVASQSQG
jgi:hypothetical protein